MKATASFCGLCFLDLRPAPTAAAVAGPGAVPAAPVGTDDGDAAQSWPCVTCGEPNAMTEASCRACGAGFLAQVARSEAPLLVLPVVGDLSRLSRPQGIALAAAVVLAVVALVALLGLLPV